MYVTTGSPSGYYYEEGKDPSKVAFWLEGGGLCFEPIDCLERAKKDLGSSVHWEDTYTDTNNVLSNDPKINPFANWSHVYVPYCSGAQLLILTIPLATIETDLP